MAIPTESVMAPGPPLAPTLLVEFAECPLQLVPFSGLDAAIALECDEDLVVDGVGVVEHDHLPSLLLVCGWWYAVVTRSAVRRTNVVGSGVAPTGAAGAARGPPPTAGSVALLPGCGDDRRAGVIRR